MILWACSCLCTGMDWMDWLIFFLLLFGGHGNLELCENKLRFGHLPVSRLNATLTLVARVAERVHCLCIYSNLLWFQRLKCINSHWNWIWLWILVVWPPVVERLLLLLLIHHDWSHNITQQNKTKQNNKKNSLFWCLLGNNSPSVSCFFIFCKWYVCTASRWDWWILSNWMAFALYFVSSIFYLHLFPSRLLPSV